MSDKVEGEGAGDASEESPPAIVLFVSSRYPKREGRMCAVLNAFELIQAAQKSDAYRICRDSKVWKGVKQG